MLTCRWDAGDSFITCMDVENASNLTDGHHFTFICYGHGAAKFNLSVQVQFSPDGRWLVSASFDKAIKLWDGVKGTFVATFRGHVGPVYQVAWSADSRLIVSGSKDSTLKVLMAS